LVLNTFGNCSLLKVMLDWADHHNCVMSEPPSPPSPCIYPWTLCQRHTTEDKICISVRFRKKGRKTPPKKKHCDSWWCYCCNDQNKTWHNTQQDLYLSEVHKGNLLQLLLLLLLLTMKPETKSIPDSASNLSVIDLGYVPIPLEMAITDFQEETLHHPPGEIGQSCQCGHTASVTEDSTCSTSSLHRMLTFEEY
jgi:hypothetical protein